MTESYTPQTNAPRVLILGAGELGKETALAFHSLGVNVHVAGSYKHAPGAQVAPNAYALNLGDEAQLSELIDVVRPDFIVPATSGINSEALEKCSTKKGGVVPGARAISLAFDREAVMAVASEELGLPTPRFGFASTKQELEELVELVGTPCVVSPVADTQTTQQRVINSAADIGDVDGRVMVHALVDHDVAVTLLVGRSIDTASGKLANWFCEPIAHSGLESYQPAVVSSAAMDNARSVAARIVNFIGGRGLFSIDLLISGDDVYFCGLSPRPHQAGMVTLMSQRFSQFELHARAILGLPLDVTLTSPGACAMITAEKDLHEVYYAGIPEALSVPESELRLFGKMDAYSGRIMGAGLATAEDTDTALVRARSVAAAVSLEG